MLGAGAMSDCLACDESRCGADFIRCAGANRRSVGIASDIARPAAQICAAPRLIARADLLSE